MKVGKIFNLQWQCLITNKGFTLLEMLLAVFIGTIVLTVIYSSFFQIVKSKDITENELDLYHEVRVVFTKMTEDFNAAYPRGMVYVGSANSDTNFFVGEKDGENSSISFTSLSRKPNSNSIDSDQAEISYYLEPIPESDLFVLMRSENPYIGGESSGIQYAISENLVGFNIGYFSGDAEEGFVDEFDSNKTGSLPKVVEVTLTLRSPRGEDVSFSSLILIPLGN